MKDLDPEFLLECMKEQDDGILINIEVKYLLALGEGIAAWYLRFLCKLFWNHLTTFVAYPIINVVFIELFAANWALGHL